MTRSRIELWSPGPLANTLYLSRLIIYQSIDLSQTVQIYLSIYLSKCIHFYLSIYGQDFFIHACFVQENRPERSMIKKKKKKKKKTERKSWWNKYHVRKKKSVFRALSTLHEVHTISFQTFFVWALLLIVHAWNNSPLRSNFLWLQYTRCTVPATSRRSHGSPLVWACQWPLSQPLSSPQLSHNDSLPWA